MNQKHTTHNRQANVRLGHGNVLRHTPCPPHGATEQSVGSSQIRAPLKVAFGMVHCHNDLCAKGTFFHPLAVQIDDSLS